MTSFRLSHQMAWRVPALTAISGNSAGPVARMARPAEVPADVNPGDPAAEMAAGCAALEAVAEQLEERAR
jgi:hypothetical protein